MAAILILPENEAFRKVDLGGVLCVFLYSPTEPNYVKKHSLTFISIKYLGTFHLKMQIIHIVRSNYLTLPLFVTILKIHINYWFIGGHFGFYPKTRLSPRWIRVGFYRGFYITPRSQIALKYLC